MRMLMETVISVGKSVESRGNVYPRVIFQEVTWNLIVREVTEVNMLRYKLHTKIYFKPKETANETLLRY